MTLKSKVLAWNQSPRPNGIHYFDEELCQKAKVGELFDYCQIGEAIIFDITDGSTYSKNTSFKELSKLTRKADGWTTKILESGLVPFSTSH